MAVPVKLWALLWTIMGISLTGNAMLTCVLTAACFLYLAVQKNWRLMGGFALFCGILALLLYLIRYHGLHMVVFSEFYVLMFWNLSPVFLVGWDLITTPPGELAAFLSRIHMPTAVILGLLVLFRFFPTMKAELKGVGRSMAQPGTDGPGTAAHPSGGLLRICIGAHAATLPAACRPAFRIRGGPGSGSPGEAGQLS